MPTLCHACAVGASAIAHPLGTAHDQIGCCGICGALGCGHHGQRDPSRPLYVCVECDPSLLVRSVNPNAPAAPNAHGHTFESVDDFAERRPRYGNLVERIGEYELAWAAEPWHSPELRDLPPLDAEGETLLLLAGVLAHEVLGEVQAKLLDDLRRHVRKRINRW